MHGAYWHKLIHTINAHKVRLFYLFGSVNSFDVLAPQTSHGTTKNCNYGRYGQHFNITIVVYLEQYSLLLLLGPRGTTNSALLRVIPNYF